MMDRANNRLDDPGESGGMARSGGAWSWGRGLAGLVFLALLALVLWAGLADKLTFATFARHHDAIRAWVDHHGVLSIGVFILLYFVAVTFSLPGAVWMTIIGGYVFGAVAGTVYVVVGATLGATAIFLVARYVLGAAWRNRISGKTMRRMERGFREHAFSYLLVLRLIPLFPFWLVNLVPAFTGVSTRVYLAGTFLGIIPGTAVYASVGNGLGAALEAGSKPDLSIILDPAILGPLLGLAALALLPVAYKSLKRRKGEEEGRDHGTD
jgi:uncharacterized membrane protein YdjX (TVP38/TMEM64 family)